MIGEPVRIGVLGCGNVSRQYLPNLLRMPGIQVAAVGDVLTERAKATAGEYGVAGWGEPRRLLADPDLELLLNLTPISTHVELTEAAIAADKHTYSEKPLAVRLDDALRLLEQSRQRRVTLACAPDTLLGSGFQSARAVLREGRIGRPLTADAVMLRSALGTSQYGLGTNPFFDMAPYYVSALVNLFGPVQRVSGATRTLNEQIIEREQANAAAALMSGTLEFAGDMVASLTVMWGTTYRHEVPSVTVYGTEGVLRVPNPNNFGDPAFVRSHDDEDWEEVKGSRQPSELPWNLRGLGVAEMAGAVRQGRAPRASAEIAAHIVDVISGLVTSADEGRRVAMTTTCQPAEPLAGDVRAELLGLGQE